MMVQLLFKDGVCIFSLLLSMIVVLLDVALCCLYLCCILSLFLGLDLCVLLPDVVLLYMSRIIVLLYPLIVSVMQLLQLMRLLVHMLIVIFMFMIFIILTITIATTALLCYIMIVIIIVRIMPKAGKQQKKSGF